MGDDLRNFDREYETLGSSGGPVVDRARRRASVEGRVHLDCGKLSRIVREKIACLHACLPPPISPSGRVSGCESAPLLDALGSPLREANIICVAIVPVPTENSVCSERASTGTPTLG